MGSQRYVIYEKGKEKSIEEVVAELESSGYNNT
jgi:hypothetical protein